MMICGAISMEGCTDLYRLGNGRLTVMRHLDEIFRPIVRCHTGAMGPRLLLVHNNACPHVAIVCREFLESETIDTTDSAMPWSRSGHHLSPRTSSVISLGALTLSGRHVVPILTTPITSISVDISSIIFLSPL